MYVGLKPDVSKAYVKGAQLLILCKLKKGPKLGRLAPGSDPAPGHYQPSDEFCVVFRSEQLLPFAVIHFA